MAAAIGDVKAIHENLTGLKQLACGAVGVSSPYGEGGAMLSINVGPWWAWVCAVPYVLRWAQRVVGRACGGVKLLL